MGFPLRMLDEVFIVLGSESQLVDPTERKGSPALIRPMFCDYARLVGPDPTNVLAFSIPVTPLRIVDED
jgi:hypothetical protein